MFSYAANLVRVNKSSEALKGTNIWSHICQSCVYLCVCGTCCFFHVEGQSSEKTLKRFVKEKKMHVNEEPWAHAV